MVLKTFLTQHPSGLYAVCGAESPAAGDTVTADDVTRLLAALSREFRYVVVDTAPGLSEQTLAALDRATDVVMLTSMDVPGVRGLRKELDVLRELCMIPAGRHVVMNFADPKGGLSVRDVETTIGTGVDVVLPRSKAAAGVDQPGRAAAAERAARPDGQGAAAAGRPLRRRPRSSSPGATAPSTGPRPDGACREPRRPPRRRPAACASPDRAPARGPVTAPRHRPVRARPRPPPAAARRADPAQGPRAARRCSSAWAAGSTTPSLSEDAAARARCSPSSTRWSRRRRSRSAAEERPRLIRELADDVLGYGPLQRLLDDPTVTEIMVNGPDQIYVEQQRQADPDRRPASPPRSTCAGSSSGSSPGSAGASTSPRRWSTPGWPTGPGSTRSSRRWPSAARR